MDIIDLAGSIAVEAQLKKRQGLDACGCSECLRLSAEIGKWLDADEPSVSPPPSPPAPKLASAWLCYVCLRKANGEACHVCGTSRQAQ